MAKSLRAHRLTQIDSGVHTIRDFIIEAARELAFVSPSARLDAELLMAKVLGITRAQLFSRYLTEISRDCEETFQELLKRRKEHEPVAYLTGIKEFWGLEFLVTKDVLVPRPETELLVELALEALKSGAGTMQMLDLGTGSGCLAVSLAYETKAWEENIRIVALDLSEAALRIAKANAIRHGVRESIQFVRSDWFSGLHGGADFFDVVVCNPPYVSPHSDTFSPEILHEPALALFAEQKGLSEISRLIEQVHLFLKPQGVFFCEMGDGQKDAIGGIVSSQSRGRFAKMRVYNDMAGKERVFGLQLQAKSPQS